MQSTSWGGWWAAIGCLLLTGQCSAQADADGKGDKAASIRTAGKPAINEIEPAALDHPLAPVLKFAEDSQRYVERAVRNYSCQLIKRERIDDTLSDYQYARLTVREEVRQGDVAHTPFAAFVEFVAPANILGRKVLYVSDENENKMLVRRGGKRLSYLVVKLDPHGPSARQESRVPITEASFARIIGGLIEVLKRDIEADPQGANTLVQHSSQARINGQACSVIRVVHPRKDKGLAFYTGTVYIDQKLHVPVRIEARGWPEQPEQEPPLLAEYTYTDLKLNVPLGDEQFQPDAVRGR